MAKKNGGKGPATKPAPKVAQAAFPDPIGDLSGPAMMSEQTMWEDQRRFREERDKERRVEQELAMGQEAMKRMPEFADGRDAGKWLAGFLLAFREGMATDPTTRDPSADPGAAGVNVAGEQAEPGRGDEKPSDVM